VSLVLDSSATLAWIYADELTQAVEQVFDTVISSNAWVPVIWPLEVGNSLQMAVRHGRIKASFRDATLADLALMNIKIDDETNIHVCSTTMQLAQKFKLTLYDAAYIELAHRKSLSLASLNKELRAAARAMHLRLLGM
jgi:predicted nucleic acid-binding protein